VFTEELSWAKGRDLDFGSAGRFLPAAKADAARATYSVALSEARALSSVNGKV
jgi:hypothetical protein